MSASLPVGWSWHMEDGWVGVVRCARKIQGRTLTDVYLTDEDTIVITGRDEAPASVVIAVCGAARPTPGGAK